MIFHSGIVEVSQYTIPHGISLYNQLSIKSERGLALTETGRSNPLICFTLHFLYFTFRDSSLRHYFPRSSFCWRHSIAMQVAYEQVKPRDTFSFPCPSTLSVFPMLWNNNDAKKLSQVCIFLCKTFFMLFLLYASSSVNCLIRNTVFSCHCS
jgi:hypothetical protein